jgi:hypothetical protein
LETMPVGRYFIFVGSILFTLLLFVDWYFPGSAVAPRADVDRSILRIKSDHRWPERIVIDTSQPTIVPPAAVAENAPAARDSRQAFARVISPPPLSSSVISPLSSGIGIKAERHRKPKLARRVPPVPVAGFQQAYARDTVAGGW